MATSSSSTLTAREQSLRVRLMPFIDRYGVLLVVLGMILIGYALEPKVFLSFLNVSNIMNQIAFNALLALGVFVVIITAGIDLSVGSILVLSMMSMALMAHPEKIPAWVPDNVRMALSSVLPAPWYVLIFVPPIIGVLCGMINGWGLTKLRLPHPFIMTLGTLNIFRGVSNLISGGVPISDLPDQVRWAGYEKIAITPDIDIPASMLVLIVTFGLMSLFLNHTRIGRHIYAIGGNPQAAKVSGINVDRTLVVVYALCGLLAGMAGLLLAGRTNSGFPNAGLGQELDAISAVIIGGASFFGGRGNVLGVFAGALVIGIMRNLLNLRDVPVFWQQILIGVIIILVVYFDVLRRKAGSGRES